MALVLVDVDGTLLGGASERLFIRYLLARGRLGWRQWLAFARFAGHHAPHLGRHVFKKNKAYLTGLPVALVGQEAAAFVEGRLLGLVRPQLKARLAAHVRAGDRVYLLTGTPEFLAKPLARGLGLHGAVGSRCCTRAGCFTPELPLRHPFGQDKVRAALELCREWQVDPRDCVAYGDSIFDAPLFERVGRAVAVAPDRALRSRADLEGWEVLA